MRVKTLISLLGALALATTVTQGKPLYDSVRSYVTILNNKNFDAQVIKNRQKGITIVNFYKESGKSINQSIPLKISNHFSYRWRVEGTCRAVRKLCQREQGNVQNRFS